MPKPAPARSSGTSEKDPAIRIHQLRKVYRQIRSRQELTAIDQIDLEVARGERVSIVGPTGCGKSTLFRIICGLELPTSGSVEVEGRCPYEDFEWYRGRLGLVFQEDRLLPWRTALENVMLGLEFLDPPPGDRQERALEWLQRLGLGASSGAYPGELSGGMRQRVAMARAFALTPGIVLADEAFSKLDPVTARKLRRDFLELCIQQKTTLVLVTHQLDEAIEVGERVVVFGKPARIIDQVATSTLSEGERLQIRERLERALGN